MNAKRKNASGLSIEELTAMLAEVQSQLAKIRSAPAAPAPDPARRKKPTDTKELMARIGRNIADCRHKAGIATQSELARLLHTNSGRINALERGKLKSVTLKYLAAIANELGVDVSDFFRMDSARPSTAEDLSFQ